ncbi:uncharacterized protein LOC111122357 [Crassostrea virginica]|uniref:Uncharacterized protein LOC111117737 n=1 Tax=Crassostrea virginica TaxID=6565 RepID=A0A8B8CBW4_CRAVI|nr:uncharacterized protein LOC111117737 [Crassostrea virginica]XP_022319810.1 uncharacterized protein LOC111122357 [Crassostrea virginica]
MPENGKMKILAAFVGVVLMIISFASPGWVIIKADGNSYDYFVREHKVKVYLSAGLWYFSLCFNSTNLRPYIGPVESNGCYVGNYIQSPNRVVEETFLKLTKDWLLEMRIWSSVGICSAALGFIGTIVAIRYMMRSKCAGMVAFVSFSVSVGSFVAAMAKTLIATNYNKGTIMMIYYIPCMIYFQCPWSLVVGAIGSLFVVISAIGHLCHISAAGA